jgi:hypothetical protein
MLELTVFLKQRIDTTAEGDRQRCNINIKRLLLFLKSSNKFSKYALEMFTAIAQSEALFSEEIHHRVSWGGFVNWNGGCGKNVECDLTQEICNRMSMSVVKSMGVNKTNKNIVRASKASAGLHRIVEQFDKVTHIHKVSQRHSSISPKDDELMMLKDLNKLHPFRYSPGRFHHTFKDIKISPLSNLCFSDLHQWINDHKKKIGYRVGKGQQ